MKKHIVFIIPSLSIGGAEKSLINLLSVFDYKKFDIDLFLLSNTGSLLKKIPKEVTLLNVGINFDIFSLPLIKSCLIYLFKLNLIMVIHRILFAIKNNIYSANRAEQYGWRHLSKAIGQFPKNYDVTIGYLEKTSIYCCIDNFKAKKKVGFIRVNYASLCLDKKFDKRYFDNVDFLCSNGIASLTILKKEFPTLINKMRSINNVTLVSNILELSNEFYPLDITKINLVTVGRLNKQKGYDIAIKACRILVSEGFDVKWTIIGEGPERESLEKLIVENQLKDQFILLGEKENPYPYIAQASIYVQPSRYEGRSNTIIEAKILQKPIVVTNFKTVFEQITNNVNGLIANQEEGSLANNLIRIINDRELQNKFVNTLSVSNNSFLEELNEFYKLLE